MPNIAQWANTRNVYSSTKYNRLVTEQIVDGYSLQGLRQQLKKVLGEPEAHHS